MSKKCGECSNFDHSLSKCNKIQDESIRETDTVICCPFYELRPKTVFDRITASPEVLAEKLVSLNAVFVTNINPKQQWISTLTEDVYPTKAEAIAATVARLKEVPK